MSLAYSEIGLALLIRLLIEIYGWAALSQFVLILIMALFDDVAWFDFLNFGSFLEKVNWSPAVGQFNGNWSFGICLIVFWKLEILSQTFQLFQLVFKLIAFVK